MASPGEPEVRSIVPTQPIIWAKIMVTKEKHYLRNLLSSCFCFYYVLGEVRSLGTLQFLISESNKNKKKVCVFLVFHSNNLPHSVSNLGFFGTVTGTKITVSSSETHPWQGHGKGRQCSSHAALLMQGWVSYINNMRACCFLFPPGNFSQVFKPNNRHRHRSLQIHTHTKTQLVYLFSISVQITLRYFNNLHE